MNLRVTVPAVQAQRQAGFLHDGERRLAAREVADAKCGIRCCAGQKDLAHSAYDATGFGTRDLFGRSMVGWGKGVISGSKHIYAGSVARMCSY